MNPSRDANDQAIEFTVAKAASNPRRLDSRGRNIRGLSRVYARLVLLVAIAAASAQSYPPPTTPLSYPFKGGDFMGFSVDVRLGKPWSFAVPADAPFTLGKAFVQSKEPSWFPTSSQELSLALSSISGGMLRGARGEYQFTMTRRKPTLAVFYMRASWLKATTMDRAEVLGILSNAREEEFRAKIANVLEYRSSPDKSLGSECLRIEARFHEKSNSRELVGTRRFLCPHPDMPAYVIEIGYGEQSDLRDDLKGLETDLKPLLTSFHLRPLAGNLQDLTGKELSGSHAVGIPVGCFAGFIAATRDAIWVAASRRVVLRIDPRSGRVIEVMDVRKPVVGIVPVGDDLWLATDHSGDATNRFGDVLLRLDLRTKTIAKYRAKEAESLGLKNASELVVGLDPPVVMLGGAKWELRGTDGLIRRNIENGDIIGDPLFITGRFSTNYLAMGDGVLWVSSEQAGLIYRLELNSTPVH